MRLRSLTSREKPSTLAQVEHFVGLDDAIKELMARAKLNQSQLADRAGISPSKVSRYLSRRALPSLKTLDSLISGLGVDIVSFAEAMHRHNPLYDVPFEGDERDRPDPPDESELDIESAIARAVRKAVRD